MEDKIIISRFEEDLSQSSPQTVSSRSSYARKFLGFAEGKPLSEWDKSLAFAFLKRLEEEGYAPNTRRQVFGIVKRVYDAAKAVHEQEKIRQLSEVNPKDPSAVAEILKVMSLPPPRWDVGKRALAGLRPSGERPTVKLDEIKVMVEAARGGKLELAEICYLALSSVYGLRRGELCAVRREHFDFDEPTLFVMTEKGGERRPQLLCPEIIDYLKEYSFGVEYSPFMMSAMFKKICSKAGIENKNGVGWHCLRALVDTELSNRFEPIKVKVFLRWWLSGSSEMLERYYRERLKVDREIIYGGHPVVSLWA